MKKISYLVGSAALFVLPVVASAQGFGAGGDLTSLFRNILDFVNATLIPFIIGIGFLVFVWGMFQYFIAGGANEESKEKGKSLMVYAVLGFVLIIVFWGVINLLVGSIGFGNAPLPTIPTGPTLP